MLGKSNDDRGGDVEYDWDTPVSTSKAEICARFRTHMEALVAGRVSMEMSIEVKISKPNNKTPYSMRLIIFVFNI